MDMCGSAQTVTLASGIRFLAVLFKQTTFRHQDRASDLFLVPSLLARLIPWRRVFVKPKLAFQEVKKMKNSKRIVPVFLLIALSVIGLSVQAQRKRAPRRSRARVTRPTINSRLTGTYRFDATRSDDARAVADQATNNLSAENRQAVLDDVMARLESPDMLAIEQRGRTVTLASSRASQITFDADGQERSESAGNGRTVRSRATVYGDRLEVSSTGDRSTDYNVTFESLANGQGLNVTRRIYSDQLDQPIVVKSFYDKTSNIAQWDIYRGQQGYSGETRTETATNAFLIPDGTRLVAVLNKDLSTKQSRDHDPFTLTVREPSQYSGATIDGYVSGITQSGKLTGRSQMTLNFEHIRLANGRTYRFAGIVDSVRASGGESIRVDNEGSVQSSSRTTKTETRGAIGVGVGAIIGAIVGGGKGAAIGAILGGGAGAGSVYIQGQENLELRNGTELTLHSSAPQTVRGAR
jgi:hypothetical protein